MADVLEEHEGTFSKAGRTIDNVRFADDIDGLAGIEQELAPLFERIDQTSQAYVMEISALKNYRLATSTAFTKNKGKRP